MSKFITHLFYSGDTLRPTIAFSDNEELRPLGTTISLTFDTSERFCTGWHDLASGETHPCPEAAKTDKKYSICPACQNRTGFNPAFYHSATVSPQQEARNAEPHHLYLAYMGDGYIKVGISWHKRGIKRLLDQGARAGLILETFPTALIARQYEAKIARLESIHETTATRTKLALLNTPVIETDAKKQLLAARSRIEEALAVSLPGEDVLFLDKHYTTNTPITGDVTAQTDPIISGVVEALIGDILVTRYNDRKLALPLKQFVGYPVEVEGEVIPLDLGPQQMQLF